MRVERAGKYKAERIAPPMLPAVGSIHAKEPDAHGLAPPPIGNALPTIDRRDINYEEEHLVGAGTFGTVYKGILRQHVNTEIAIQVMNKISHGETTRISEILHNFNHENILKFLGMCPAIHCGQYDYLVFELMRYISYKMCLPAVLVTHQTSNLGTRAPSDMFNAGRVMHKIFTEGPEPKFVFRKFGFREDAESEDLPCLVPSVRPNCQEALSEIEKILLWVLDDKDGTVPTWTPILVTKEPQ
ncbi:hypothetical protein Pelo_18156 [Pelomyxa schiedti]|nr:hypothetical protein Pelo_18156 [Pelomyxa schiedti]